MENQMEKHAERKETGMDWDDRAVEGLGLGDMPCQVFAVQQVLLPLLETC